MDFMDSEICVKGEIADVPRGIGNEAKANRSEGLKYLNVRLFRRSP